jgi:hypothetical protein
MELTPRREGARGEVGKPSRVPVRGWTLELEARFAWPLCHRDLVRVQQVGQLQDVGHPILLPLQWAEVLARPHDPISDCGGRRGLEQTGVQAGLPFGETGFQAFLPRCCLTSILLVLFLAAFLAALFLALVLSALFLVLFLVTLEKLQECQHLGRW